MTKIKQMILLLMSTVVLVYSQLINVNAQVPTTAPDSAVYDETGVLSKEVYQYVQELNQQLQQTTTKPQVAVLFVNTLDGQTIEELALTTARNWKVGFSSTNNGVLFVAAIKDRKMRLETSDNIAQYLPDSLTKEMINLARDDFRSQNYSAGVKKVLSELVNTYLIRLDESEVLQKQVSERNGVSVLSIISSALGIVALILSLTTAWLSVNGGRRRGRRGRRYLPLYYDDYNDYRHHRSVNDNHHYHSSSSGSDFSGGGFSGGGSSSSW